MLLIYFIDVEWFSIQFIEHFIWFYIGILGVAITGIAILQMNVHLTPFPSPKDNSKLITNGVYKLSRHPMYTGILVFMFSFSFWLGDGYKFSISLATLVVFYFKSKYEEQLLIKKFENYSAYKTKAGRFLPKL